MTTPSGVPNLPAGALTLDNLASATQDMTGGAMKTRAVSRFPSIFNTSTGLNPALELTPFGILTRIWAEVNSLIANADPADIQGPEDLPPLVLEFIEGLPVIGQFVGILEAIIGTYDGDDPVLLAVQDIFAPIQKLMQLITGSGDGFPTLEEITEAWGLPFMPAVQKLIDDAWDVFNNGVQGTTTGNPVSAWFPALQGIFNVAGQSQSQNVVQDAQITTLLLAASGTTTPIIGENWDGAANTSPNSTNWNLTHDPVRGSGGGAPLLTGTGQLKWSKDGSGLASGYRLRWKPEVTDTDYQLIQLNLMSDMPNASLTRPYAGVAGRMDIAETAWIEIRVDAAGVEIGYVVGGFYARLGSFVPVSGSKAGIWSLKTGTDVDDREFVLYHGTSFVTSQIDSTDASMLGDSYRSVGMYYVCGNQLDPFFGATQRGPANCGSFGASDRSPAT